MSAVAIRSAIAADAPEVSRLLDQLGHPLDAARVAVNIDRLTNAGLAPLAAVKDGQLVGVCALSLMHTVHRPSPVGRVSMMVVDEGVRGGGIGAALVAEAEGRLAEAGCYMVEVTSNVTRERAHRFYEKLGYERTSVRFAKTL